MAASEAVQPRQADRIEIVFSAGVIARRIEELAEEISGDNDGELVVVPVLTGSFVFAADLIRALRHAGLAPLVDFISLSSYGEAKSSSGSVEVLRDLKIDIRDRDVLIVDDILDSGRTLKFARDLMAEHGARTVKTCVLLTKNVERQVTLVPDYRAFECPDEFVVGYGMDHAYRWRELPFVGRLVATTPGRQAD